MRLYGEGEHGTAGRSPGRSVCCRSRTRSIRSFIVKTTISLRDARSAFPTLALGGTIHVPTLDGRRVGARFQQARSLARVSSCGGKGDAYTSIGPRSGETSMPHCPRGGAEETDEGKRRHTLEELHRLLPQEKLDDEAGEWRRSRSSNASKTSLARSPALDLTFSPGPGAGTLQDMLYAELMHSSRSPFRNAKPETAGACSSAQPPIAMPPEARSHPSSAMRCFTSRRSRLTMRIGRGGARRRSPLFASDASSSRRLGATIRIPDPGQPIPI